eukprot:CAMPEP_0197173314 /NCGR_PEP_ID=MMETSP1423-20130617/296_1 /TAXON_ID=476441 /ORGANISM="Pseudo-nitzschia heimii, Strain UNC1101" /LENGTH=270 /DNA_ID=CAMNT_0042622115 /DNA_START=127 /DNA_END=939 /DNA_ORIENTATION=+
MYAAYRSSVFSIASTASRRVYHSSIRSLKASVNGGTKKAPASPPSTKSATEKVAAETAKAGEASSSSSSFAKENPFVFQLGVATAKTSAADLVAQMVAEKKSLDEVDWKRNFIFVVFGFAYLGAFQYWLMVNKFRQWFPTMDRFAKLSFADKLKDTAGILDAAKMVVFDVTVHLPIIYFPTYYTVKEFVGGKSWNPTDWAKDGVTKYINNAKDDLSAMIKLWGPSDCIQFVLPMYIRLPFRHLVSFFWTAYVSFTRGSLEDKAVEQPQKV